MTFIIKKHQHNNGDILIAIIDEELVGKIVEEGNKILDLTNNFYKGEKKSESEILEIISKANHLNVVGNNIVEFLTNKNLINSANTIGGVAYAQAIVVRK